jgi:hypothetical protein
MGDQGPTVKGRGGRRRKPAQVAAPPPEAPPPGRKHRAKAGKAEQDSRLDVILEWIEQAKSTPWKYAEARIRWNIGDRQYRKLETRVLDGLRAAQGAQRPYDTEVARARLEALIREAWVKGDREEARRATFTLWRITAAPMASTEMPAPAPPSQQINIGNLVVDMRGLTPIEKQRRLAELESRRQRFLSSATKDLDPAPADEAGDGHG